MIRDYLRKVQRLIRYVQRRMGEKSTMTAIVGAIGTAALVPAPWSYWAYAGQVILALYPEAKNRQDKEGSE